MNRKSRSSYFIYFLLGEISGESFFLFKLVDVFLLVIQYKGDFYQIKKKYDELERKERIMKCVEAAALKKRRQNYHIHEHLRSKSN